VLRLADRTLFATVAALALIGGAGLAVLAAHGTVADWLAPAGCIVAIAAAARRRPPVPHAAAAPRWLLAACALVLLAVAAALAFGAIATTSRHWDGAVAWDVKAGFLAANPTLEQPFFRASGVYNHSRDYPLLQPLWIALAERAGLPGRAVLPVAYGVLILAVACGLRRAGVHGGRALLATLACGLTPLLVTPTSGAVDSGYGDAWLAASIAVAACGVAVRDPALLALGTFVCVQQKPEGIPYAGALVAAVWWRGDSASLRAAVLGWLTGAALALALQHDLHTAGTGSIALPTLLAVSALGSLVLGTDRWLARRGAGTTARLRLLLVALPACLLALPLVPVMVDDAGGTYAAYLGEPSRALARLARVPEVLLGLLVFALLRGAFGLTFVVPIVAAVALRRRRVADPAPALSAWLVLASPLLLAPFLLSAIDDLDHHLRSTLPRLLLHWTGAVWLWAGTAWNAIATDAPNTTGAAAGAAQ
jgi:hypothetical protein